MAFQDNDDKADRKQRGRPRAFHEKTEQNTIKSLDRALVVLAEVARAEGITLSALAQRLGESPATIYRVLTTLALHQIVESNDSAQTWHIGAGAFLIGSAFLRRTSLVETSRPILRDLMETTGETANLGVEKDGHVLFLGQVETHAPIRAFFPPGTLSPLHASGIGKVLLAYFDAPRLHRFGTAGLARFTPHTLADMADLQADLAQIRTRGYSVDDQERNIGMRCIAAPIRNALGEVIAGISVSGPTSRIAPDEVAKLATAVISAAARVSEALGASPQNAPD
ncbi:HTH-type transcriptional regulator BhcR [Roseobacter sp. N2S]|uniref:HTH-type transcriptional regulator BhcR n=1 Tax=Roseobacter sp. N2S TaxID=2663844 RepID=UPI00285BA463|nr:HTH-type transcriptional regulator BhcR [Roseobacter sp. N2S]MDR6266489.1 IclR family acetate operon transcriptional repressor [Roseobacter sp. N2S]